MADIVKKYYENIKEIFDKAAPETEKDNAEIAMVWCRFLEWVGAPDIVSPDDPVFLQLQGTSVGNRAIAIPKCTRPRRDDEPVQDRGFNIADDDQITEWKVIRVKENKITENKNGKS